MRGRGVVIDLFAGLGGASLALEQALGVPVSAAVNHWPIAISVHAENHRTTTHLIDDVRNVKPLDVTRGEHVLALWASPTCSYFSRAYGGELSPETIAIRALADAVIPWLRDTRPDFAFLENVVEFLQWGPIVDGRPDRNRRGEHFSEWRRQIEDLGYSFDARTIRACDYGAPTTRERMFAVMRADGQRARWPMPTHGPGCEHPHRTAAEIIDWPIPCPSIFERSKPLAPPTQRRIARGLRKFVLEAAEPFLLHLTHGDRHAPHSINDPLATVTGAHRGEQAVVQPFLAKLRGTSDSHVSASARSVDEPISTISAGGTHHAVVAPYLVHRSNGERPGQAPRIYDVRAPHPTVVAGGIKTALVGAYIAKHYSERHANEVQGSPLDKPLGTVTAQDHHALVTACASGADHAHDVYAFCVDHGVDGPWLDHAARVVRVGDSVVVDIGMRMLRPRELARAQGFPDDYVIDRAAGKPITLTDQVRMIGNSVSPYPAAAIIRAQFEPASAPRQLSLLEAA